MKTRTLSLALLAPALALVLLAGCRSNAQEAPVPAPVPVRTASVHHETRALPIRTSGRLAPKAETRLSFKTSGLIDRFFVDEGDRVRAGRLLARLDLSEIDAQVRQARSAFEKAERDAARMEALFRDSVATLEQLQNTRTARDVAASTLEIARFNRRHSEIRAATEGRVLRRLAESGELVTPGKTVLIVGGVRDWVVRVGLADRDVVRLRLGDRAAFRFDAFPDRVFTGRVSEIAEAADPTTGTFEVEVTVDDPERRLKSGFIAHVDLYPSSGETFALIPVEALVEADGEEGRVFAFDDATNRARSRSVRIARLLGDTLAVRTGLERVAAVITEGAAYLDDGDLVRVIPPR